MPTLDASQVVRCISGKTRRHTRIAMVLLPVALAIGRAACDRDGQCRAPRLDVRSQGGPNACLAYFAQATD